ncbi:S9 family peptidase [Porticoccaceae bacterium LTM1]|nr:S9 family peptidase [Porticoccaceae bacterium LTM1]
MYRICQAIVVSILISLTANAEQFGKDPLQALDLFELEYASSPEISPDGEQVAYVRHFNDVMTDMRYTNLWIVSSDGNDHRPISTGKHHIFSPAWSPDGKRLAYVSTESGSAQIYMRWMDTGATTAITNLPKAPGSIKWSPDGSMIAFAMFKPINSPLMIGQMPIPPAGAKWAPPAKMTDKLIFRFNGSGDLPDGYTQLYVVPSEGGTPRQVTHGDYNHGGFISSPAQYCWSPDGNSLIVSANRNDNWEQNFFLTDIFEFSLSGGEPSRLTNRHGGENEVAVSPTNKYLAFTGHDENYKAAEQNRLYIASRDGSNLKVLSAKLDRPVSSPRWSADGKYIYVVYDSEGVTRLGRFDLNGNFTEMARNLGTGDFNYGMGSFSLSKNNTYTYAINKPDVLGEVGVGRNGGKSSQITHLNDDLFSQRELGKVEEIWWKSSKDGRNIQGWLVKPPQFDPAKKYPLILEIHGGPTANYGPRFDIEKQLMASDGYLVLYANPRGSNSYGQEFVDLIDRVFPGDEYHDLNSGVDAVISMGYVDSNRVYVTGGSGGGTLTAWMISNTDRFKAAVSFYPVINWESFVFTADMSAHYLSHWMPGLPWEHRDNYEKRSILSASGNVKTPTLIMTGEEDWRTPMSESEQYYKALKLQGVESVLVRVPGEGHGIFARPSHHLSKMTTLLGWFKKHSE